MNGVCGSPSARLCNRIAFLCGTISAQAQAEPYPNRPIRIVVPTQAGAAQDILARLLQPHLEKALGQPVIVENRSGASTMIGTEAVAKATPDGHTLLIVPTTFTVNAALNAKLSFDLERDFEPITVLVKNPLLFAVNAKVPAKTLGEFVALAKAEPGKLNYGTSGASTQAHLLLEMWSAQAGIKMQHIPYRGGAPAALAVAAGEVQIVLLSPLGILAAGTGRAGASARDRRAHPRSQAAGPADRGRGRLPGLRGGAMARPAHHRRHAERRSSRGSTPR